MRKTTLVAGLSLCLFTAAAQAHTGTGALGGFQSGFLHPILGFDHLLAMLLVGIWGAQLGGRNVWTLPVVFPLVMALGGFAGAAGLPLPGVEPVIALSVVGLGLAVAFAAKPPEWVALVAAGVFAVFHGYAHGAELPEAADGVAYGIGFVLATGLIHLAGIGFGLATLPRLEGRIARVAGAAMSLAGVYFLLA
jgi:urease accessory protein